MPREYGDMTTMILTLIMWQKGSIQDAPISSWALENPSQLKNKIPLSEKQTYLNVTEYLDIFIAQVSIGHFVEELSSLGKLF